MSRKKAFLGFDWMELAEHWGLEKEESTDEELAILVQQYLHEAVVAKGKHLASVAADVRRFLKALARNAAGFDYAFPVWKGMASIKSEPGGDEELCKLASAWLSFLWS